MINILETPNSGHQYFPVFGNLKVDNMSKYLENFKCVYTNNEPHYCCCQPGKDKLWNQNYKYSDCGSLELSKSRQIGAKL